MFKIVIYTILSIFKNSPPGLGQPPVADVAEVAFCSDRGMANAREKTHGNCGLIREKEWAIANGANMCCRT